MGLLRVCTSIRISVLKPIVKYHNNLMAVAHTFMTSQRKFELTDFNTVVESQGLTARFSDGKTGYENVISGNMQLGEALGITGTPGFIIMNMKSRMRRLPHLSPGLWTQQLCRAHRKSSRGLKLLSHLMSTAMPVEGRYAFTTSNSSQRVVYLGDASNGRFIRKILLNAFPSKTELRRFIEPVHNFHQCLTAARPGEYQTG